MITVRVKFYGVVRDVAPSAEVELQMPQEKPTVRQLLASLTERLGKRFAEGVLDSRSGVKPYVRLFVNSEEIDSYHLDASLQSQNARSEVTVYVLPATEGGQACLAIP